MKWLMAVLVCAASGAVAQTNKSVLSTAVATNEPTVVTSDRLQVDYAHNVGTFEGNVLAVDPRITVRADKVIAFFGGGTNKTRQVERLLAQGGVVITQENRKATGEQAEYIAAEGKVILTGNPQVQLPQGTVTGVKITFRHGDEKMDVESDTTNTNRTRLTIFPEDLRKKTE